MSLIVKASVGTQAYRAASSSGGPRNCRAFGDSSSARSRCRWSPSSRMLMACPWTMLLAPGMRWQHPGSCRHRSSPASYRCGGAPGLLSSVLQVASDTVCQTRDQRPDRSADCFLQFFRRFGDKEAQRCSASDYRCHAHAVRLGLLSANALGALPCASGGWLSGGCHAQSCLNTATRCN